MTCNTNPFDIILNVYKDLHANDYLTMFFWQEILSYTFELRNLELAKSQVMMSPMHYCDVTNLRILIFY